MFLFPTSIQTGKNLCSLGTPGPPRQNVAGTRPGQQLCFRWSQHSEGECAAGRRAGQQTSSSGTAGRRPRATMNEASSRKNHVSS